MSLELDTFSVAAIDQVVKVVKRQEGPSDEERCSARAADELEAQLHVCEVRVPELVEWALGGATRAEQVDRTKVAEAVALILPLDAIEHAVPPAVLALVGDAKVDAHAS